VVENAQKHAAPVIRWCLLEVLGRCPAERDCRSCPLWEECQGVAKTQCDGFVRIEDAIAMKRRVSRETWEAEMLCRRPSLRHAVFANFREEEHLREEMKEGNAMSGEISLSLDFGFASPFVCLWIRRWEDGRVHVIDEYVQPGRQMKEHLEHIEQRG